MGLHPEKHEKLRDYPKLKANNLVEIIQKTKFLGNGINPTKLIARNYA